MVGDNNCMHIQNSHSGKFTQRRSAQHDPVFPGDNQRLDAGFFRNTCEVCAALGIPEILS